MILYLLFAFVSCALADMNAAVRTNDPQTFAPMTAPFLLLCKNCNPHGNMPVEELTCTNTGGGWRCHSVPNEIVAIDILAIWDCDLPEEIDSPVNRITVDNVLQIEVSEEWLSGESDDVHTDETRELVAQYGTVFSSDPRSHSPLRCTNCGRIRSPVEKLTCTNTDEGWRCRSVPSMVTSFGVEGPDWLFTYASRTLMFEVSEAWLAEKEAERKKSCVECLDYATWYQFGFIWWRPPFPFEFIWWRMPKSCYEACGIDEELLRSLQY